MLTASSEFHAKHSSHIDVGSNTGDSAEAPEETWRVSGFHFAPKWWSGDGRGFTLVFNVGNDAWNTVTGRLK